MATTKSTAKKPASKKPVAKKTVAKKPASAAAAAKKPVKKIVAKAAPKKTTRASKAKEVEFQSFKLAKTTPKFTEFKITRQTVYWIVLLSFIIFAQLWILKIQIEVATLLEQQSIEALAE